MLAAVEGLDGVVASLCQCKTCQPNRPNKSGKYPVHFMAMKNHFDSILHLVDAGCDVNVLDADGCTPLWYAVKRNRPETVKVLLMANCKVDIPTENNSHNSIPSPLQVALDRNLFKLARLLVLAGCSVLPIYEWLQDVRLEREERKADREATLWVEGRHLDAAEEELNTAEEEAEHWFSDWLHSPHSLKQLCRITVRRCFDSLIHRSAPHLPLPQSMLDYITLKEVDDYHIPGWLM